MVFSPFPLPVVIGIVLLLMMLVGVEIWEVFEPQMIDYFENCDPCRITP